MTRTRILPWVKELIDEDNAERGFVSLEIGKRYYHKGRIVEITGGAYWGTHGVSNHWHWRPVRADGTLGEDEHGYDNEGAFAPVTVQ